MKFKCMGNDKKGKFQEVAIRAKSRDEAFRKMKENGFTNISVVEAPSFFARTSIKSKDIAMIFRQLAAYSSAGETFPRALASVADVTPNPALKDALLDIRRRVEGGQSISSSFTEHKCFPKIIVNLLKVGESSGDMEHTLDELAGYLQQVNNIESGVSSAMMYPKIIVVVMFLAIIFMVSNVLPKFRQFYTDMHIEMPLVTKLMYAFSDFLNNEWFIALPSVMLLVYIVKNLRNYIPDTYDYLMIRTPIVKRVMINLYMYRFCKTLQILVSANVDIIESMELVSDTMENHVYVKPIKESIPMIRAGSGITSSLRSNDTGREFDSMVIGFLQSGENTNNIDGLMGKASAYYQRELGMEIDNFGKAIEPILLVVIAIFVAILVISVYLPIFKMSQIKL